MTRPEVTIPKIRGDHPESPGGVLVVIATAERGEPRELANTTRCHTINEL